MTSIVAMARHSFENYCKNNNINDNNIPEDSFFICIHNSFGIENTKPFFKELHDNVLNLYFDDCSEDYITSDLADLVGELVIERAFTKDQAQSVIDFLDKQKECGRDNGIIHCQAGISRSGAVASFTANYFNMNKFVFKSLNPKIIPNPHVLSTLNGILWDKHFEY